MVLAARQYALMSPNLPICKARRDCPEFGVRAGIMGEKESYYASTQRACHPVRVTGSRSGGKGAASALDQGGLLDALNKALGERVLNVEMDHHLDAEAQAGQHA